MPDSIVARFRAREIVLKSTELSRGARLLYMALDNYQRDGASCWPRQSTLREVVGCSARSLKYYLAELIEAELVTSVRRNFGGPNEYRLQWGNPLPLSGATHCPSVGQPIAPYKANQALKPDIRTSFGQSVDFVKGELRRYPYAVALAGIPDDEIVLDVMRAAGSWLDLRGALQAMYRKRAAPSDSWAWFPVVVSRFCARAEKIA